MAAKAPDALTVIDTAVIPFYLYTAYRACYLAEIAPVTDSAVDVRFKFYKVGDGICDCLRDELQCRRLRKFKIAKHKTL